MSEYTKNRLAEVIEEARLWQERFDAGRRFMRNEIARKPLPVLQKQVAVRWGHIYVIPAREFVKVGISLNPVKRWNALYCGNPMLEPMIYMSPCLKYARSVEGQIHSALQQYIVSGSCREWFRCDRALAVSTAKRFAEGNL